MLDTDVQDEKIWKNIYFLKGKKMKKYIYFLKKQSGINISIKNGTFGRLKWQLIMSLIF